MQVMTPAQLFKFIRSHHIHTHTYNIYLCVKTKHVTHIQVIEGRDKVKLAVHGLGKDQINAGFICTCQAYCTGPGIVVKLGTYDECYEGQYGKYEKSYEMKFGEREEDKPKKKNIFGW